MEVDVHLCKTQLIIGDCVQAKPEIEDEKREVENLKGKKKKSHFPVLYVRNFIERIEESDASHLRHVTATSDNTVFRVLPTGLLRILKTPST